MVPFKEALDTVLVSDERVACKAPLQLVHVDADCLVVDKPAGVLSVPGRGPLLQDSMAARVQAEFEGASVVHRLDMATSGLLLFARNPAAQRALSGAFARREVHKHYVAVVDGHVAAGGGEIDLPLGADWPRRPRQQIDVVRGKPSLTRYRTSRSGQGDAAHLDDPFVNDGPFDGPSFSAGGDHTRLMLQPVTGRTHQLRVHLQAIGHPIIGDTLYAPAEVACKADRLLLHAAVLGFAHPRTGAWVQLRSTPAF